MKCAEEHQHAVVGLAQLVELDALVLVQRAHRVAGDDEHAAPDHQVEPAPTARSHPLPPPRGARGCRTSSGHEQDAAKRRQRRVPASVEVRRAERRQGVEAEHHPLGVHRQVQQQANPNIDRSSQSSLFTSSMRPNLGLITSCSWLIPKHHVARTRDTTDRAMARTAPRRTRFGQVTGAEEFGAG